MTTFLQGAKKPFEWYSNATYDIRYLYVNKKLVLQGHDIIPKTSQQVLAYYMYSGMINKAAKLLEG